MYVITAGYRLQIYLIMTSVLCVNQYSGDHIRIADWRVHVGILKINSIMALGIAIIYKSYNHPL